MAKMFYSPIKFSANNEWLLHRIYIISFRVPNVIFKMHVEFIDLKYTPALLAKCIYKNRGNLWLKQLVRSCGDFLTQDFFNHDQELSY